jgi:hypothetical protein
MQSETVILLFLDDLQNFLKQLQVSSAFLCTAGTVTSVVSKD